MLISSYNPKSLGDILLIMLAPNEGEQDFEQKGQVVRIFDKKSNKTLGLNFLEVSSYISDIQGCGQIFLNENQVQQLNDKLSELGFEVELKVDNEPKFVVGHVDEMTEHPDSDHLHITKTTVDGKQLQIVCGAPNIEEGQNVVVAKVGAMMPTGDIIWPGKLRGVESDGMICSARELHLPNAPEKRGILVLNPSEYPTGATFDFSKAQSLFA